MLTGNSGSMLYRICVDGHQTSLSNIHPILHLLRTWQTDIAAFGCASALCHSALYDHKQQVPFLHAELENGGPQIEGRCITFFAISGKDGVQMEVLE